jgi:STE24 endopeptidase
VWAVAAWLLWRSSVPALHLPRLDAHALVPARTLHEADRYSAGARRLWLGGTAVQILALAVYARIGVRFTRESAAGPVGTGMLLGMLGFALVWAAQLPFAVLTVWWRRHNGLGGSYVQATFGDWLALGAEFVFLCAALAIVMGLARRVGDRWWLPAAPCFVGLSLLFAFVTPWLLGGRPLGSPELRAATTRLERIEHVRHVPVRVLDGFDEPNAFSTGLGPSRRVFLWSPIVEPPFTNRQIEVVIAHELGHLAHEHIWKSLGWYALFAFPGTFLLALATRRRGGMAVPAAVPLSLLVLVVLELVALPLQNAVTRRMEVEADWSALRATRDPAAARGLFERFVGATLSDPDPPAWDYVLLENHPTLLQRIELARAYAVRSR